MHFLNFVAVLVITRRLFSLLGQSVTISTLSPIPHLFAFILNLAEPSFSLLKSFGTLKLLAVLLLTVLPIALLFTFLTRKIIMQANSVAVLLKTVYTPDHPPKPVEIRIVSSNRNFQFYFTKEHKNVCQRFIQLLIWLHSRLHTYYNMKRQPFLRGVSFSHYFDPILRILDELIGAYVSIPPLAIQNDLLYYDSHHFTDGAFHIEQSGCSFPTVLNNIATDIKLLIQMTILSDMQTQSRKILNRCDEAYSMIIFYSYFFQPLIKYSQTRIDRILPKLEVDTFMSARTRLFKGPFFVFSF